MNQAIAAKAAVLASEHRVRDRHAPTPVLLAGVVGDTLVVFLALALSSWLRFETPLAHFGFAAGTVYWTDYSINVVFGAVLFILLLPHRQLYDLNRMLNLRQTVPL